MGFEKAAREGREARLTEGRARAAISAIYEIANREKLPMASIRIYLKKWIDQKRRTVAPTSLPEYQRSADQLLDFLDSKADRPLEAVTAQDLSGFRDHIADRLADATVNKTIKILKGAWLSAVRDGYLRDNVFSRVTMLKQTRGKRRAFTLKELGAILEACGQQEWRGIVLFGLYTGQRLGDVARLTWRNVDLENDELRFVTRKTQRESALPIAKPLHEFLMNITAPDDPDAPLFPVAHNTAQERTGTLSNQFREILVAAGLAEKRTHQKQGTGRDARRETGGLSFHCLRHTATSLLKNAGVSDAVAKEIIGHESAVVSRAYTHIETDTMKVALDKLPDITKPKASQSSVGET